MISSIVGQYNNIKRSNLIWCTGLPLLLGSRSLIIKNRQTRYESFWSKSYKMRSRRPLKCCYTPFFSATQIQHYSSGDHYISGISTVYNMQKHPAKLGNRKNILDAQNILTKLLKYNKFTQNTSRQLDTNVHNNIKIYCGQIYQ